MSSSQVITGRPKNMSYGDYRFERKRNQMAIREYLRGHGQRNITNVIHKRGTGEVIKFPN